MVNRDEAIQEVMAYLANRASLDALEDWSAEASIEIHNSADGAVRNLVYSVRGLLNEHEDDDSPASLKEALLEAVADIVIDASSSQTAELFADRASEELRVAA